MGTGRGSHHCLVKPAYTAQVGETAEGFRRRARFEAARYGSDPWVFVRELLQNARDAGAGEVRFRVETDDGRERISCRDDGDGMTFEHARRYLFTLYASSKLDQRDAAGRFGIGFWSVLRFEPDLITVRSRPADADGWEFRVDGGFRSVRQHSLVMQPGTEVVLERPATGDDLEALLHRAVHCHARFLRRRDQPDAAVQIVINGTAVDDNDELPMPNVRMEEPGLRLTAALAESPRVEVFAHGLRVREAAFLDELLLSDADRDGVSMELSDGLLPRVVLDSDQLHVLLARGDARDDANLRRLVRRAEREVERLVGAELDQIAARSLPARWFDAARRAMKGPLGLFLGTLVVAAVAGLTVLGITRLGDREGEITATTVEPVAVAPTPTALSLPEPASAPYRDLGSLYTGPSIDALAGGPPIELRYWPDAAAPLFVARRIASIGGDGTPVPQQPPDPAVPYGGPPCAQDCLEVELRIDAEPGLMQLPVASGHRVDPSTVRLDEVPVALVETELGDPALVVNDALTGVLRYVSGPGPAVLPGRIPNWPELPDAMIEAAADLTGMPLPDRVTAATELVQRSVAYDRSPDAALRFRELMDGGRGVLATALEVGAGDCDVQNSLLAAVLTHSEIPAWLAVGYVGADGYPVGGLHAWVEYLDGDQWRVADASAAWEVFAPESEEVAVTPIEPSPVAEEPQPVPEPRAESTPGRGGASRLWLLGIGVVALLGAVGAMLMGRRRSNHTIEADGTVDVARLLRGALLRPRAYGAVNSLYSRRLVPAVTGGRLSLATVMARAREHRLFRSDLGSELAHKVSGLGETVVDAELAEGRVVADLLGGRDIDAWSGVTDRARANPATDRMEEALEKLGERWLVRVADDAPDDVAVIEGRVVGYPTSGRLVVVDEASPLWTTAVEELPDRPAWSAFVVADGIADALDLGPETRRRWLAVLAHQAVAEGRPGPA